MRAEIHTLQTVASARIGALPYNNTASGTTGRWVGQPVGWWAAETHWTETKAAPTRGIILYKASYLKGVFIVAIFISIHEDT